MAEWGLPGEPCLDDFLRQKMSTGEPIDFVRGSGPIWTYPPSREKFGFVKGVKLRDVELLIDDELDLVPRDESQAVRSILIRPQRLLESARLRRYALDCKLSDEKQPKAAESGQLELSKCDDRN